MQTTGYDTMRFNSEKEAEEAGEIYKMEYPYPKMIVTDPDGKKTEFTMNYRPVAGLDVSDHSTLFGFIDKDMDKRDSGSK